MHQWINYHHTASNLLMSQLSINAKKKKKKLYIRSIIIYDLKYFVEIEIYNYLVKNIYNLIKNNYFYL